MRSARLRHRLIIERPDPSQDANGSEVITWVPITAKPIWAAIEPMKGREQANAGQIVADLDTLIVIRWSPRVDQVTPKYRARHAELRNPTIYNLQSVAHINLGRREIQILAKSGTNRG